MRKVYITLRKEPLRTEDAVRVETYFDGLKKRNLYIFNCKTCQSEIRIRKHNLKSSTGLCRGCAVSRPTSACVYVLLSGVIELWYALLKNEKLKFP